MDSTLKGNPKHATTTTSSATKPSHTTTEDPDPTLPSKPFFMSSHFSRLTPNHKTHRPQNPTDKRYQPPPRKDIHLQAKAMTVSADADSSVLLPFQPNNARYKTVKEALKDTIRKSDSELDRKKSERKLITAKKKAQNDAVFEAKKADLAVKSKQLKDLQQRHDVKRNAVPLRSRRSICGLQVELAHMIANFGVKIVSVDMPPFMQIHAVDCARKTHDSLENFTPKALALTLKKEFDGVYGPAWHCIVGTSFGSFVTHSVGGFFYFSMDQKLYILLFKTTVQGAD